jgi:hypothetical protein
MSPAIALASVSEAEFVARPHPSRANKVLRKGHVRLSKAEVGAAAGARRGRRRYCDLHLIRSLAFMFEIMVDPFGNYLFQKILEKRSPRSA